MNQTKYEKRIQLLQKEVTRLTEENRALKQELQTCTSGSAADSLSAVRRVEQEFYQLCDELTDLKSQYTDLLQEFSRTMNRERTHFKRQTDQSIRRINRSLND